MQEPLANDHPITELSIPSDPRNLGVVRNAVEKVARDVGFVPSDIDGIVLATDEALANVMKHGYEGRKDCTIHVRLEFMTLPGGSRGLQVIVRDYGKQVDPALIRGRDLNDVRPGGLGVHIIRSVMDQVEYTCPEGGGMRLRMVKFLPDANRSPASSERRQAGTK